MTTLEAKVNIGERQASKEQYVCAGVIWGGFVFTLVTCIWGCVGRNAAFTADCQPPWRFSEEAGLCVTQALYDDIHDKCAKSAHLEAMKASTEAPMTQWTLNLVTDIGVVAKQRSRNNLTLEEVARVQGLTEDSMKEAAFRVVALGATEKKNMMQLLSAPHLLPLFLPLIILVAAIWFTILHYHAEAAMWSTVVFFALGMLYVAFLSYNAGSNRKGNDNDGPNYNPLIVVGLTLAYIIMMVRKKAQISLGCSCLQLGLTAVLDSKFSLPVIVSAGVLQLIYTGLLICTFVFTSMILHVSSPAGDRPCFVHPVSGDLSFVFTFLFLLTSSFCTMVVVYTLSFGVGCWYFGGDSNDPAPMVTGLKMALTTPNGTGATAQAGFVMAVVEYVSKKTKNSSSFLNPCFCLVAGLYCCIRQVMESLCTFALVAVAIHGGPFTETSRKAKDALGAEKAGRFILVDANLTWLIRLQALTITTIIGLLALFAVDRAELGGVIFGGIVQGVGHAHDHDSAMSMQYIIIALVGALFVLLRRPVTTMGFVLFIYILDKERRLPTEINAVFASIVVGCIGSIVFHQFAEAAKGSLDSLLYCFSLDEANGFKASSKSEHTQLIKDLMEKTKDLEALQPATAAAREPMAFADHLGQVGCIQP